MALLKVHTRPELSPEWWTAAMKADKEGKAPTELRPLFDDLNAEVHVDHGRHQEVFDWCASLPGWEPNHAISFHPN